MPKTAIVIGASGLVGSSLVDQLATSQHIERVICLNRRPMPHKHTNVSHYEIYFEQLDTAVKYLQGDYLFSCLGTTKKAAGSVEAQRHVDFDHQYTIAKIAAKQGVEHYLLVSAIGANAASNNAYLKMKGELEQKILRLPFKRISIIRPSLLLGERQERRWGESAAAVVMPTLCKLPVPILRKYQPVSAEHVASQLVEASRRLHHGVICG